MEIKDNTVKRKLVTGTIEAGLGLVVLIFCWVTGASLYTYLGWLLLASGGLTLVICGLRILADKKAEEKKAKQEEQVQPVEEVKENTTEEVLAVEQKEEQVIDVVEQQEQSIEKKEDSTDTTTENK